MDWGYALSAGITVIGMIAAYGAGRRARQAPKEPKPDCPCGHAVSFHESLTGKCRQSELHLIETRNGPVSKEYPCLCQHYAGPELIPTFLMRPTVVQVEPPKPAPE